MGVLDRILGRGPGYTVHLAPADRAFTGHRGDRLYERGHVPVTVAGGPLPESSHETSDPHVHQCQVAGTHHMPSAIADGRFDLGSRIRVQLQPGATDDALSVGIWDAGDSIQVGFVPTTLSRSLGPSLRRGRHLSGQVIRELRLGAPDGERLALYVLVAPEGRLELVHHEPPADAAAAGQ